MDFESWGAFYHSDLQSLVLVLIVPSLFLLYLVICVTDVRTPAQKFMRAWALFFSVETLIDPIATGPLTAKLALPDLAATIVLFTFVVLGDFRVLVVLLTEAGRARDLRGGALRAAALSLVVPALTGLLYAPIWAGLIHAPGQTLWLIYETGFATLALFLRSRLRDADLRAVALYAFTYYALWIASDLLILAGVDLGWLLRVVPNQLYYAFTVPFVWWHTRRT